MLYLYFFSRRNATLKCYQKFQRDSTQWKKIKVTLQTIILVQTLITLYRQHCTNQEPVPVFHAFAPSMSYACHFTYKKISHFLNKKHPTVTFFCLSVEPLLTAWSRTSPNLHRAYLVVKPPTLTFLSHPVTSISVEDKGQLCASAEGWNPRRIEDVKEQGGTDQRHLLVTHVKIFRFVNIYQKIEEIRNMS